MVEWNWAGPLKRKEAHWLPDLSDCFQVSTPTHSPFFCTLLVAMYSHSLLWNHGPDSAPRQVMPVLPTSLTSLPSSQKSLCGTSRTGEATTQIWSFVALNPPENSKPSSIASDLCPPSMVHICLAGEVSPYITSVLDFFLQPPTPPWDAAADRESQMAAQASRPQAVCLSDFSLT